MHYEVIYNALYMTALSKVLYIYLLALARAVCQEFLSMSGRAKVHRAS